MSCKEKMRAWLQEHPEATPEEAFEAGWYACTDAWCHGKREKFEKIVEYVKEIIE